MISKLKHCAIINVHYSFMNLNEKLSSYGYGFTFDSPFGLLELIVGKAPKTLSASSKKITTFKVNLGYKFQEFKSLPHDGQN